MKTTVGNELRVNNYAAVACLPFIGRKAEISQLESLSQARKHVLLLGRTGIGKTALVNRMQNDCRLLISSMSEHFGSICSDLESQLGLTDDGLRLHPRKARLLKILRETPQTVVFDSVSWITPKLASFLELVMSRVPVWICTRSAYPWDIGHFWSLLINFEKVQLRAFHLAETECVIQTAVNADIIPAEAAGIAKWLHSRSKGVPGVLQQLLGELAARSYDLTNPRALKRLQLDSHIHTVFPNAAVGIEGSKING